MTPPPVLLLLLPRKTRMRLISSVKTRKKMPRRSALKQNALLPTTKRRLTNPKPLPRCVACAKNFDERHFKLCWQSIVTLEVKPWDDETDMAALEASVRSIEQPGLVWGSSKFVPIGYGIRKLQITIVIGRLPSFPRRINSF